MDLGWRNFVVMRVLRAATGGRPANTLGHHQRLFRRWLRFACALMPGGRLPRVDTELLILRVAHNLSLWPLKRQPRASTSSRRQALTRRVCAWMSASGG